MGLFEFGKKKNEETKNGCCCGSVSAEEPACGCNGLVSENKTYAASEECCVCGKNGCNIKVLGAGCKSCHEQYENVKKAVIDMNLAADVEYITDMEKVMSYGVMSIPAIVVNEKVVTMGKVLKEDQVEELLKKLGC